MRILVATALLALLPACGACDAYDPVNAPLPRLDLASLDGAPLDLAQFRGQPLVLHLWLPS